MAADYERFKVEMLEHIGKLEDQVQQQVLIRRFGATDDNQAQTLQRVGQSLGLTAEEVREIEVQGLQALCAIPRFTEEHFVPGSAPFLVRQALQRTTTDNQ